jgi:hypothetical protein
LLVVEQVVVLVLLVEVLANLVLVHLEVRVQHLIEHILPLLAEVIKTQEFLQVVVLQAEMTLLAVDFILAAAVVVLQILATLAVQVVLVNLMEELAEAIAAVAVEAGS